MNEQGNSRSLFPAYASASVAKNDEEPQGWLVNASFSVDAYQSLLQKEVSYHSAEEESSSDSIRNDDLLSGETEENIKHDVKCDGRKRQHHGKEREHSEIQENSFLLKHLKSVVFLEETGLSCERAFRLDTRHDPQNFALGSFDRKTIPKYTLIEKPPLGCSNKESLKWTKLLQKRKKKKRIVRYFSKGSIKKMNSILPQHCYPHISEDVRSQLPVYLPLSVCSEESIVEVGGMKDFGGVSATWKTHFNKAAFNMSHDREVDTKEHPGQLDKELKEKILYFNNAVTESVHDEQLWLDFVDFQIELFHSPAFSRNGSVSEKSLLEKQTAILDKALKFNPRSVKLMVTKLQLLRNVTEKDELFSLWEKLVFYHPQDVLAWQCFLNFVLSDLTYFTVSQIAKLYRKCLRMLSSILEGDFKSHLPPPGLLLNMLDIFSYVCAIFDGCGHKERALGTFQALLEYNFFTPQVVCDLDSNSDQITFFEPFWDSGVPRIGEENATGWSRTVMEKKVTVNADASVLDLSDLENEILIKRLPSWQMWVEFELLRESNHLLPWRPDPHEEGDDDLDDPERIISFDQISGFLFRVRDQRLQFLLLVKFFSFLGVNLHFIGCSSFMEGEHFCLSFENFSLLSEAIESAFPNKNVPDALKFPVRSKGFSSFIDSVFSQVIDLFPSEYSVLLSLIWLKHRRTVACQDLIGSKRRDVFGPHKKFAKSLLKRTENRSCLFLWSEYIQLEWLSNNKEKADQIFETLLASSTEESSSESIDLQMLRYFVRKYVELSFNINTFSNSETNKTENYDRFTWILYHVGSKKKYVPYDSTQQLNPTLIVKAIAEFRASLDKELGYLKPEDEFFCSCLDPLTQPLLDSVWCAAYLQYFAQGFGPANQQFADILLHVQSIIKENHSKNLRYIEEQLVVCQSQLLNFHIQRSRSSYKPLQIFLCTAAEQFPGNAWLLYLLVKTKTALAVVGQTRRFFYELTKSNRQLSPITWLFAIISELTICCCLQEPLTYSEIAPSNQEANSMTMKNCGIIWKVRSLFENAMKCSKTQHSVALWRFNVKFEMWTEQTSRAKAVFHQALQNCPWSKALYLDGIEYFPEEFDNLVALMSEKELRIHTPPEEIALLTAHALKQQSE